MKKSTTKNKAIKIYSKASKRSSRYMVYMRKHNAATSAPGRGKFGDISPSAIDIFGLLRGWLSSKGSKV